ncbi:MAG: 2-oxo acid dehydrogenase subunit E2 [Chloroflexi bacterium]|nr:2-oxo acid dehydrogenase subunit E2 [Chloroflexota bacterium]
MPTQVTMPMLGLTMEEGTVAEWLKHEGDTVQKDEPLLLVEMDKGTQEVPSPAGGVLRRIVVQQGTTVPVKTLIAEIAAPGEAASSAPPEAPAAPAPAGGPGDRPPVEATPREVADASSASTGSPRSTDASSASIGAPRGTGSAVSGQRLFVSPRARMRARSLSIDLSSVRGSGPHGRIVESDVLALTSEPSAERVVSTPLARRLAQEHGVSITDVKGSGPGGRVTQDDVMRAAQERVPVQDGQAGAAQPLTRLRRLTAERMAASAQATARVTLFLEADFSELARFRKQLQPEFARLGTEKLPWDALIAKAAALALVEHRAVLAQWAEGQTLRHPETVNVGIAVALEPEGLVVPVLRDADKRSLRDLAADLVGLADKARAGRLSPAEMQGGGFTITNLGAYRIDGFTPIVNPPETAILGVGRVADKAVVVDGKIEARTMCSLSLSFDHRVVDGAPAAAFLARLAELLERPYALLGI